MNINLPDNIDYSKYHSKNGMATKKWGPKMWDSLFISILGRYPIKINNKNKEHQCIKRVFRSTLQNLQYTLPCVYCRNSFKEFIKEIPISKFLTGRIELMFWLYLIKSKVNEKLNKKNIPFITVLNHYERYRAGNCKESTFSCN